MCRKAARKHGLTVAEIEDWQERFLLTAENGLRANPKDEEALKDEHITKLKQVAEPQGDAHFTAIRLAEDALRITFGAGRHRRLLDRGSEVPLAADGRPIPVADLLP